MDRIYLSGAAASPPTIPASPSTGYPTEGNPSTNTPATNPGAWWFHMLVEEIRAVIVLGGLTPSGSTLDQMATALQALFGTSLATTAVRVAGGKIIQWGTYSADITGASPTILFPATFPNACDVVIAMPRNPTPDGTADSWLTLRSKSTTGFVIGSDWAGTGGSDVVHGADWVAIGR